MAINAILTQFQDELGIDLEHTVVKRIYLDFISNKLTIQLGHYLEAGDYNNAKSQIRSSEYTFNVTALPTQVVTDAVSLKNTIEAEMIDNLPAYASGIQVNDDGTPII